MRCATRVVRTILAIVATSTVPCTARAQGTAPGLVTSDTVRFHLADVELRAAVEVLGQYLDRPIVLGAVTGNRVTLETPSAIQRRDVPALLKGLLDSQNMELVADSSGPYRVRQRNPTSMSGPSSFAPTTGFGAVQLFVVHLNHARAADVAATVNALYGRATAFGDIAAPQPTTLSQELRQNQQITLNGPIAPAPGQGPWRPGALSSETTIIPDAGTNSLLIRATPADFALIQAAVKEVDVRPLQVLIEVVIAEARRDRSLAFGVDVSLPATNGRGRLGQSVADATQTGLTGSLGDVVLHVLGIGGDRNLEATLRAAAGRGDVSIISRPTVIAANNEKAEIVVGSQRPFVQVSRSLPTDAPTRDQVVQYKDVGTKLIVRPTISTDGYVTLQVTQEVNAATSEFAFDAPVISTRSVQTQLLLKDGQTVIIGGLTDHQREMVQGGVPVLSSIPWVGGLFGHVSRRTSETELFLFITPRVIRTDEDADSITAPLRDRANKTTH